MNDIINILSLECLFSLFYT